MIVFALAPGLNAGAESARASVSAIPDEVWSYMQGRSWHAERGCPQRSDLALLRIPYRDFEGRTQFGPMIVARKVAGKVAAIFQDIYDSGAFRIYRIALVDDYGGDDDQSIAANNTSGFNCRTTEGGGRFATCPRLGHRHQSGAKPLCRARRHRARGGQAL